ncbi:hypothetical protein ACJJTC_012348 [Scirpophaga incertulas]
MLRSILRTSRWLARRRINTLPSIIKCTNKSIPCLVKIYDSHLLRSFSAKPSDEVDSTDCIDPSIFEEICSETLESLSDYFEEIIDQSPNLKGADVTYSDGVLTVALGSQYGTYVINRQTPNKQIWLSSPTSGPKRYDLVLKNGGYWIYKHDGMTLHKLLQEELSKIFNRNLDFKQCSHSLF